MSLDIGDVISGVSNVVSGAINGIQDFIESENDGTHSFINNLISDIRNRVQSAYYATEDNIEDAENAISSDINSATASTKAKVDAKATEVKNAIQAQSDAMQTRVSQSADSVKNTVQIQANAVVNNVQSFLTGIGQLISSTSENLGSIVADVYEEATDKNVKAIKDQTDAIENIRNVIDTKSKETNEVLDERLKDIGETLLESSAILQFLNSIFTKTDWQAQFNTLFEPIFGLEDLFNEITHGEIDNVRELNLRLENILGNAWFAKIVFAVIASIPTVLGTINAYSQPYIANLQRLALEDAKPNIASIPDIQEMFRRGMLEFEQYRELLGKNGLKQEFWQAFALLARPLIPPDTLRELFLRGKLTEAQHDDLFKQFGYLDGDIDRIKETYFFLAPVQDLIRMAVREVFTPDIATKYGLNEDYPRELTNRARQVGLNEEVAKQYWAAHWELPSPTMGYEMFQRGIITYNELEQLLRALDYMPYWRDKLIELNYNPLTRVDTRRMYGLGVINRAEVKQAYKALGYNDENAERLTEFTIRYEDDNGNSTGNEFKALTRSVYERAYDNGVMTRREAKDAIIDLGYHPDDVEILLDIIDFNNRLDSKPEKPSDSIKRAIKLTLEAYRRRSISRRDAIDTLVDFGYTAENARSELDFIDYEIQVKIKDTLVNKVKSQFLDGLITKAQLIEILSASGFIGTEITAIIKELEVVKDFKDQKPTKAELGNMLKRGIITPNQYENELSDLGYNDKYVDWYAKLIGIREI